MHNIYHTGVLDVLSEARRGTLVILKDFMDGRIEFQGFVKELFDNQNLQQQFKHHKIESFYVEDNNLIIHIV